MRKFLQKIFKTENINLTEVQEKIDKCNLNKNQLILSSCGSGKTEASFYIGSIWNKRLLYVYPMKTLASSIHKRLNNYENILKSNELWTIQHSSAMEDKFLNSKKCITTIDQVLAGYLGIGVQSFIKGKNVVCSNFIFDEIQLFEPGKTLKTTICMLDELVKRGNKFVIMTATMPEVLINFLKDRYDMEVTITDKPSVENRCVKLKYIKSINFDKIESFQNKQIIICNSQQEQEDIQNNIEDKDRIILLNSKLLKEDREIVEKQVFEFFGKDSKENNKILITTQIVEAGMDISASRMYSSLCPIDNLVQRDGRVCRWGGNGEIIVFEGVYSIYDKKVCELTLEYIKSNDEIVFSWDIQKQWINEILNDFYKEHLGNLNSFKTDTLKKGSRDDLIRDIKNVNVIVSKTFEKEDFNRQSISIPREILNKLSKNNKLYILKRSKVESVTNKEINDNDTVVIQGQDAIYDEIGFRYKEGFISREFPFDIKIKTNQIFSDYIKEEWITHALMTKEIMKEKLIKSEFRNYTEEEIEEYSTLGGLHDLGKLNRNWQKFIGMTDKPLAHNVYEKRNSLLIQDQRHEIISALSLDDIKGNKLKFNLLINHHGRKMIGLKMITVSKYRLVKGAENLIREVGYNGKIIKSQEMIDVSYKQFITPADKEWVEFVYLEGILMESDIEAINRNIEKK